MVIHFQKSKPEKSTPEKSKKKEKKPKKPAPSDSSSDESLEDDSSKGLDPGAFWIDQKRMRRVQVRSFKGKPLVDIREMYMGNNGIAPGKKGISLSIPEWRSLKKLISRVDDEIMKIT